MFKSREEIRWTISIFLNEIWILLNILFWKKKYFKQLGHIAINECGLSLLPWHISEKFLMNAIILSELFIFTEGEPGTKYGRFNSTTLFYREFSNRISIVTSEISIENTVLKDYILFVVYNYSVPHQSSVQY